MSHGSIAEGINDTTSFVSEPLGLTHDPSIIGELLINWHID